MLIAIDFDGTIVKDNHSMEVDGFSKEFLPDAINVIKALHDAGHCLVLWTLRDHQKHYNDSHIRKVLEFLSENGIDFMKLPKELGEWNNYHKFPAEKYIDDKACFKNWFNVAIEMFGMDKAMEICKETVTEMGKTCMLNENPANWPQLFSRVPPLDSILPKGIQRCFEPVCFPIDKGDKDKNG